MITNPNASSPKAASILRLGGPILVVVGLVLTVIGVGSFFASFGTMESPRHFGWALLGMPLLFLGLVLSGVGYLGEFCRYVVGQTAPVAKDAFNYLGTEAQPGIKAIAKAITEGIAERRK